MMGYWIDDIMKGYNEHSFNAGDIPKLVAEIKYPEEAYEKCISGYADRTVGMIKKLKQLEAENERLMITIVNNGQDWAALHIEKRELEAELLELKSLTTVQSVIQLTGIYKKAKEVASWHFTGAVDLQPEFRKQYKELQRLIARSNVWGDTPKHELDWPNDSCCFYREK